VPDEGMVLAHPHQEIAKWLANPFHGKNEKFSHWEPADHHCP